MASISCQHIYKIYPGATAPSVTDFNLEIQDRAKGCGACPIIKQYLTPQINKMLFYITKLSVIIITTRACTVKVP